MGVPLSVYLSPVLLALAILITDLVNFVFRTPDIGGIVWNLLERLINGDPAIFQAVGWIVLIWLLPGVTGLLFLYLLVRWRLRAVGGDAIATSLRSRPPRRRDPEEVQLVNIVAEYSAAASIVPPRVLLIDRRIWNAFIYGPDPNRSTIVVGRKLLDALDREATQGVIARLVASASNGDLALATDIGAVYVTFGLLTTTLSAVVSHRARARLRSGLRGLVGRGKPGRAESGLGALFGIPIDDDFDSEAPKAYLTLLTMSGFIGAGMSLVNLFLAGPLLVLAWRSRVHLADAVAVDLTRNPTALARALRELGDDRGMPGSAWLELLLVAGGAATSKGDPRHGQTLSDTGLAPAIAPSVAERITRLEAMGATSAIGTIPSKPRPRERQDAGLRRRLVYRFGGLRIVPLLAIVGLLAVAATTLLIFLVAFFAFTILALVAGPIHVAIRSLAGQ
jgi:Zn-dependent protease with chaperone function